MVVFVAMVAHERYGVYRAVEVGGQGHVYDVLNDVFRSGQNDFNPQHVCSVSTGDVVLLDRQHFRVDFAGFSALSEAEWLATLCEWEVRSRRQQR